MNPSYTNRYIAFLDILGFKNLVNQSASTPGLLAKINQALNYTKQLQYDNYEGTMPLADLGKQVSVFSDSIIISYEMTEPGAGFFVLLDLVHICNDLLFAGMPVRGGVTIGALIHENSKCFGPAMNEAYYMESELAIYPRILIHPDVLKYDIMYKGVNNTPEYEKEFLQSLIAIDQSDNSIYLDYLSQNGEFNDSATYIYYMECTRQLIINCLQQHQGNSKILLKYEWLKNYFNRTIARFGGCMQHLMII